jgi:hypothetical protein
MVTRANLSLERLDSRTAKLDHLATGNANKVIVVAVAVSGFEPDSALDIYGFAKQPRFQEMRERSIHGRARDVCSPVRELSVEFFRCEVTLSGHNVFEHLPTLLGGSKPVTVKVLVEYFPPQPHASSCT